MKLEIPDECLNEPMRDGMVRLIERCRNAHYTNALVRINGHDESYEADWIKHIKIVPAPL